MASSTETELETLKADFAALNRTVSDLAQDIRTLLTAFVKDGEEKARSSVDDTVEGLKERLAEMRGRSRHYVDAAEQQIGQHPYTSLLTAFGIGFVLAKLLDLGRQR